MSIKNTVFYRDNKSISVNFSAEHISTDGSLVLLEKIERKQKFFKHLSSVLPDTRNPKLITYSRYQQLKQRVYMIMLGYEDANDVEHLKNDPLFKDILQGDLASQPTISRFENSMDRNSFFELSNLWVDMYIESLKGRKQIVI